MKVAISQPAYLPWLGYFDRIAQSELYIVLDHVQFEKRSFTSRNKILTARGPIWLSVPVKTKGQYGVATIDQLEIDNTQDWRTAHWKSIQHAYGKAPFYKDYAPRIEAIYQKDWDLLAPLCDAITGELLDIFEIRTKMLKSSEMTARGYKDELILNLCKEVNTTIYISGPFGREYLREDLFRENGIKIVYHDYKHPEYSQMPTSSTGEDKFEPYMCALDLLFNKGPESKAILTKGQVLVPV